MSNMRIVYDNAADRATLAASTTAGSLAVSALLNDIKSDVWRATTTTAQITMTWAMAELVGVIALPFCNLSSAATLRIRCYTLAADAAPILDTGIKPAAIGPLFDVWDWGYDPLGVNAYNYGAGYGARAYATSWFTPGHYAKIVVDIDDSSNAAGYIEASRIVSGYYWEAARNPEHGLDVSVGDTSRHERSDAGDLITDRGSIYKTMSLNLAVMPNADRDKVWRIMRGGMSKPLFLCLVPEATDPMEEQIFQIYGKLSKQSSMKYAFIKQYATQLEIEEI